MPVVDVDDVGHEAERLQHFQHRAREEDKAGVVIAEPIQTVTVEHLR
jgi:hypothetical protein